METKTKPDKAPQKEPPQMTSITIHYRGSTSDALTSAMPPVKEEAEQSVMKTLQSCLDPRISPYIAKIEINFTEDMNDE